MNRADLSREMRLRIYERDGWRCWYCGCEVEQCDSSGTMKPNTAVLDHLQAFSKSGPTQSDNLVTSCNRCNLRKQNKSLEEFRAYIRYKAHPAGEAIKHLRRGLLLADTPYNRQIGRAIRWLEGQMPPTLFYGELRPPEGET